MMEAISIFDYIEDTHYDYKKIFENGHTIEMFEAFSGIGCQRMALERLGVPYKVVGISEIDKYAIQSYMAMHGDTPNYGDITKMAFIPKCDIFTWSFPCTDLSKAGKQKGLNGGTRSGLVYEVLRLLKVTEDKPKVLIMENVVDLVQVKFAAQFYEIQRELERLGYQNYTSVLNAKDYGVAQNRERVFMVSILGGGRYEFPIPFELKTRLKDYLEPNVDEKYYLSDVQIKAMESPKFESMGIERVNQEEDVCNAITTMGGGNRQPKIVEPICLNSQVNGKQPSLQDRVYDSDGISTAITTSFMPSILIPEATKKGYAEAHDGDGVYLNRPHQKRGCVQDGMIQTLKTNGDDVGVVQGLRIRKLTPRECFRLMGISDEYFDKAQAVVSNSQLYKTAGNGIVVDVFAEILKGLIGQPPKEGTK